MRQKQCKYPPGSQVSQHQHVRRFIIPKDAYAVATKSMALIESAMQEEMGNGIHNGYRPQSGGSNRLMRPSSAPLMKRQGSSVSLKKAAAAVGKQQQQRPKTAFNRA